MNTLQRVRFVGKPIVFLLCLVPFGKLLFDFFQDALTADPIQEITLRTGWWALIMLIEGLILGVGSGIAKGVLKVWLKDDPIAEVLHGEAGRWGDAVQLFAGLQVQGDN